eukprot:RCo008427
MPTVIVDSRLPTIASFILLSLTWAFGIASASGKGWAHYTTQPGGPEFRVGLWWFCTGRSCVYDSLDTHCSSYLIASRAFIVLAIICGGLAGFSLIAVSGFRNAKLIDTVIWLTALTVVFSFFPWVVFMGYYNGCISGDKELGPGWVGSLVMFGLSLASLFSLWGWRKSMKAPAAHHTAEPQVYLEV